MTIVVVGKSSFLAREVAKHPAARNWLFLPYDKALASPGWIEKAEIVINFAFAPQFKAKAYDTQADIDSILARMIDGQRARYIMISSRMVYGQAGLNISETHPCRPANPYGAAKLAIERALAEKLDPSRLTILRLSNVFGHEPGRQTFFGRMMTTLSRNKKIVFDMGADTRRDFLPVHHFADMITRIAAAPVPGLFNLGAGFSAECGDVASWLIEGYGEGALEVTDNTVRDEFSLDIAKAQKAYDLPSFTPMLLREDVVEYGRRLQTLSS